VFVGGGSDNRAGSPRKRAPIVEYANKPTAGDMGLRKHLPLLRKAAPHIGHVAIRNRGTLGGSLAYADPAAELPACAVALGATLVLGNLAGESEVKAEDFFKGLFETDLQSGELIAAVNLSLRAPSGRPEFRLIVAPTHIPPAQG
jgi:CO/xanthine dehydrogenase FAD-binding subunit